MTINDAANNLARMIEQCGLLAVDDFYGAKNNTAPGRVIRGMIADVDKAVKEDVTRRALMEIERIAGYASDSDEARFKMLAFVGECAREAIKGKLVLEPPRSSLKPGDVLVKAGELPEPVMQTKPLAELKEIDQQFQSAITDILMHYAVPVNALGVRAKLIKGELFLDAYVDDDGWRKWSQAPLHVRVHVLTDVKAVLAHLEGSAQRTINAISSAKTELAAWVPPNKRGK